MVTSTKPNNLWGYRSLRIALALGIAVFLCQFDFHYLEALTYDLRTRYKPASAPSGNVATVTIDSKTVKTLDRAPGARDHTKALRHLARASPHAVVYIIDPGKIEGTSSQLRRMAQATQNFKAFYYGVNALPIEGKKDKLQLEPPLATIPAVAAPKTMDKTLLAQDNVTRRMIFSYYGDKTLHPRLAADFNGHTQASAYQGLFDMFSTKQAYIDFRPKGTYKPVRFIDLVNNTFNPKRLKDKIVFVGRDTQESNDDYVLTPYSRESSEAMADVELHANMMDTLIQNRAPVQAPWWQDLIITCLISVLTLYIVLGVRPARGIFFLISVFAGFAAVCYLGFMLWGWWIGMAHPILAIFICYYFFIPYRLIIENRKSWEYYQRNKLLTQVEELKSNFLRMMSHDLKTPLARIQGMTDVVSRDSNQLSENQKQALETINQSSEELSDFIGSILNLGRVEGKEIKLHLQSKDINTLLDEILSKCEYLASKKNIAIRREFEPMFSMKLDEDLMRQVFTNLIENAIKYSPENSRILISTEESHGRLIVQVADQGIGMSQEDQGNIFSKFYRSQNAQQANIKGSGLGLYLAKYFVELHAGKIEVESELGYGSTFTVTMPMNLKPQDSDWNRQGVNHAESFGG